MNLFVTNCQPHNWEACERNSLFGLKEGRSLPPLEKGDLILMRVSGPDNGVKALWYFEHAVSVTREVRVPWNDAKYSWVLHCSQIITLPHIFKEGFSGVGSRSTKIPNFPASRIQPSIIHLKNVESQAYLSHILMEYKHELSKPFTYLGNNIPIDKFLLGILSEIEKNEPKPPKTYIINPPEKQVVREIVSTPEQRYDAGDEEELIESFGTVGERIDLPILNYSPLNEMGVILLFGYYLQDLGFSHIEEIRASFPDAIGMRPIGGGKYKRVRIEFEFKSSSFKRHGHSIAGCDIIVCWIHDWLDCPLEVIELRKTLQQDES
jgi:hypothetical protein